MKIISFIVLSIITINSFAQFDRLSVDFKPSFIQNSKLIINKNNNGYSITIQNTDFNAKRKLPYTSLVDLVEFLSEYEFLHTNSIDTIEQTKVTKNGDTITQCFTTIGVDGITVSGELNSNGKKETFNFWSPRKGSLNHKLSKILFDLMNKSFYEVEIINYIEQLEQYFNFGLGIKIINEFPLTYKMYGSISKNEADELYDFFNSLPSNKVIHFDMSNFNGMGTMFDDHFLELSRTHKLIRWVNCSEKAKKALIRANVIKEKIE